MVEAGLSSLRAVGAATCGSAHALGLDDRGAIHLGKVADLLVVEGNPLDDIGILRERSRVFLVFQGGRAVAGRALDGPGLQPAR
jgi:imidazolonepropionase-like amidohydrolase